MTEYIRRGWRRLSPAAKWVLIPTGALCVILAVIAFGADHDNDGMSDDYELLFSRNPTNPAGDALSTNDPTDAAENWDGDSLVNSNEAPLWTDPFFADTDVDGWDDDEDSNALSRVYLDWGNWAYTNGNYHDYTGPNWWLDAWKEGGTWVTNDPSWHVAGSETNEVGLYVQVDRSVLTNDAVLEVTLFDHTNAVLYLDLLDTNLQEVVTNVCGNLLDGSNKEVIVQTDVPLESNQTAAVMYLRRGRGEITVYDSRVYVDQDRDGLDSEQEDQLGTSDLQSDTDSDGLDDYAEVFSHATDPLDSDTDDDSLSDGDEVNTHGTDPNNSDTDGDGMPDAWEIQHGFNPAAMNVSDVVGWWKLDETEGATTEDSSANNNDGTISGASHVSGQIDYGLQFDGDNDEVSIQNDQAYKPSILTVRLRARFDELYGNTVTNGAEDGFMVLLAQKNTGSGYAYAVYKTAENSLAFELANSSGGNTTTVETAACFVRTGEWLHIVGTYDGTNMALYVNGELIGSATHGSSLEYAAGSGLLLGHGGLTDDGYFEGVVDDVQILDVALASGVMSDLDEAVGDADSDGVMNLLEYRNGADPSDPDSDDDGLTDYQEVMTYGTDPADSDSDDDGLSDLAEVVTHGTNPNSGDSDGDGMGDAWEVQYGFNPTNLPLADLAGYWKLDDTGSIALDNSTNSNSGVISGATLVTGNVHDARSFDGVNDEIAITNASAYKPAQELTVAVYAEFNDLYGNTVTNGAEDGSMVLLAQKNAGSGYGYALYKTAENSLVFELENSVATNTTTIESSACFVRTGEWFHIVGTYDGTNMALYVNGERIDTAVHGSALEYDTGSGLVLGHGVLAQDGYFSGILDEVRVYSLALTAAETAEMGRKADDDDGDGLQNYGEAEHGSSPTDSDSDDDLIPDGWEADNGLDPTDGSDALEDPDGDRLTNIREYQNSTDPFDADSDDDYLLDGYEVDESGTSPLDADSDDDLLGEYWEVRYGLDPLAATSMGADPDGDALTNGQEQVLTTDPQHVDSDGDGMPDQWESSYTNFNPAAGYSTNLVSWWRFDERSGMVSYDDNEQWSNDGALADGAGRTPLAYTGHGLELDGVSGHVLVPDHYSLDSTNALTLVMMVSIVQFDTPGEPVYLASKEDSSGHVEYALSYLKSTQKLRFSHRNLGAQAETVSVDCDMPTNGWVQLAVTVGGSQVKFYVNGSQQGAAKTLSYSRSNTGDLIIGSTLDSGAVDPTVHGIIDEVRVYRSALTASNMAGLLEADQDGDNDGLTSVQECVHGTDPWADDTTVDSDGDGLMNAEEILTYGTDPFNADSDGDGVNDGDEVTAASDPLVADQNPTGGPAVTVTYPKDGTYILW